MSKQFWGVITAIILVFVGIAVFSGNKDNKTNGSGSSKATASQHVVGSSPSGVLLVEYGDFQCPYCQAYYPTVKQAQEEFKDQIKFQFRNFPLISLHPNAFAAARAAEAASLQGKFWEMHDMLYETSNWEVWTKASSPSTYFDNYANQLKLNLSQFKADFASDKVNATVNADMSAGNALGITGTPTFFIDGKQVEISNDIASFEKVIKAELASKAKTSNSSSKTQ